MRVRVVVLVRRPDVVKNVLSTVRMVVGRC